MGKRQISCPKCYTAIDIPESAVASEGMRVRCPQCSVGFTLKARKKKPAASAEAIESGGLPRDSSEREEIPADEFSVSTFVESSRESLVDSFMQNFKRFEPSVRSKPEVFERFGTELLDAMFANWPEPGDDKKISFLLGRLIRKTKLAEQIVGRTWLQMLHSFSEEALSQEVPMDDVFELLDQIQHYHQLMHDVYFEMIRSPDHSLPELDRSSEDYQKLLKGFGRYRSEQGGQAQPLKVVNYYKGVPVEFDVQVVKVEDDTLYCKVHHFQASALALDGVALLESPIHGTVFRGFVADVDVDRDRVCFSHIIPYGDKVERREDIRIEPDGSLMVSLAIPGGNLQGRMMDLSRKACTIYFRNVDISRLKTNMDVELEFELPSISGRDATMLKIEGPVLRISSRSFGGRNEHRVVIKFNSSLGLENRLSPYITKRQSQILMELREQKEASLDS